MLCRRCMVVMGLGTAYERKKNENGRKEIAHRRFCQCPKCKDRIYIIAPNFQETLDGVLKRR